jgi:hypothetical protein
VNISKNNVSRSLAAGIMLALWLVTSVVSSSTSLHHVLHHDSDNSKHECVVTAFHKGQMTDAVMPQICLSWTPAVFELSTIPVTSFISVPDLGFFSPRGPPALLSA